MQQILCDVLCNTIIDEKPHIGEMSLQKTFQNVLKTPWELYARLRLSQGTVECVPERSGTHCAWEVNHTPFRGCVTTLKYGRRNYIGRE